MRLREGLVHRAGHVEEAAEPRLGQRVLEAAPALAGGHRQQIAVLGQLLQALPHAFEQHRLVAPGGDPVLAGRTPECS